MKSRNKIAVLAALLLASTVARASDSIPGAPQNHPILIAHAVVHTVSGATLKDASLLFDAGKIVAVNPTAAPPANAETIDAQGQHLYPGLMDAITDVGLSEIESIRATEDQQEVGQVNSNVRAEKAVNPDSEIIPTVRANGVLLTVTAPQGGLVSGMSAAMRMDGWTFEDMTVRGALAMHVNWPQLSAGGGRRGGFGGFGGPAAGGDPVKPIRDLFASVHAYAAAKQANPVAAFDAKLDAMLPVIDRKIPMVVHADAADQIASAVGFCRKENVRLIIYGGGDAMQVAKLLKETDTPVVLDGVQRSPRHRGDAYDATYTLPAQLRAAGVKFAISSDRTASFARNLPYHAATAVAFGLAEDDAIRSITLWPAEIFGLETLGSLDAGKEATLFLSTGDILDTPSQVTRAWVVGRTVDLSSRHTRLYEKYAKKYAQQAAQAGK